MSNRIYNFSAGPAVLPVTVLEKARDEMLSFRGSGMSIMEMSHRSDQFGEVLKGATGGLRRLLDVPESYEILFLQGGASLQFSMVPMNFLGGGTADYVITGAWGLKALQSAENFGSPNVIYSSETSGFTTAPAQEELRFGAEAKYIHYTSNETIDGVEFKYDVDGENVPVVCDASSNILSKKIDVQKYDLIYAGAQKNIGPSGVCVVIVRDSLLERVVDGLPGLLDYRTFAKNDSMPNTPNTWGIYIINLVCEWLEGLGGVPAIERLNREKALTLYDCIDSSDGYYLGHAEREARSLMNITFRLPTTELEDRFCSEASAAGLDGLKGHRSVGGIRASIYNAFPKEGVERLVEFMKDFSAKNG
jgi:phosphoserine aminotransferase